MDFSGNASNKAGGMTTGDLHASGIGLMGTSAAPSNVPADGVGAVMAAVEGVKETFSDKIVLNVTREVRASPSPPMLA